jgi:hypothetical protein
VNHTALNRAVNFPQAHWTAETLDCLKTESFSYTLSRDLNLSRASMQFSVDQGFPNHQRNHLVGISDATTAWQKEVGLARSEGVEAVVLFALDQLCLIGYPCPLPESTRRSTFQG